MSEGRSLDGKVVVVTGAGRGIGRDIALLCAKEGASVVVNDLGVSTEGEGASAGPAQEVVDEIRAAGGRAVPNGDSVAEVASANRIIQSALDAFGRIDGVVNNAGFLRDRIFHRMSVVDFEAVLQVHLLGSFYMSHAAARHFKEQEGGAFVHFTSTSGLVGNFGQANYAAAKMGIVGLSRSIALDMERFGVRSNCIAPFAWSRMIATIPAQSEAERLRIARMQQMTTDKIAPLVCYLLTDLAKEVSGQIFAVRRNEIMLMSQPRPIRSVHRQEGWDVSSIHDHAMPAMKGDLTPLERSSDVFSWDPI